MKKFASLIVCVALILLSALWPSESFDRVVMAGPGNGENEEVTDIDEMLEVMRFISGRVDNDSNNSLAIRTKLAALSTLSVDEEDDEKEEKDEYEYDSLTWVEDTKLKTTTSTLKPMYDDGYYPGATPTDYEVLSKTHIELSRTLTCYMVDDASYYVSRGSIISVFDQYVEPYENTNVSFVFDIEIYVDDDVTLIKFNTFVSNADDFPEFNNVLGKWIELPAEAASDFISMIDSTNRSMFNMLADFINEGIENDEYSEKKDVYTFEFDMYGEEDGTLTVDLSTSTEPFLDCVIESTGDYGNYIEMQDRFICMNVDNTVIELDINDSVIEFDDMEEFMEFLED